MREYFITYTALKTIILNNPVYFHYQTVGNNIEIFTLRDTMVMYWAEIPSTGSEATDFETWSWMAGDWDFKSHSWKINFLTDANPYSWQLKSDDDVNEVAMLLSGRIDCENYNSGDRIQFKVIDKDGIYAPPGTVFRIFMDRHISSITPLLIVDPKQFDLPSRSKIFKGLYLELEYFKIAGGLLTAKIFAHADYEFKTEPV